MGKKAKRTSVGMVKVGSEHYEVFEQPTPVIDGVEYYGYVKHGTQEITLDAKMNPHKRRNTLLHEVLHAIDCVYGVGLSEKQVKRLEVGLIAVIEDNPDILTVK